MKAVEKRFNAPTTEIGEKTGGNGEIRVFVKSPGEADELFLLIYAIQNKSVCLNCCADVYMPKNLAAPVRKKSGKR